VTPAPTLIRRALANTLTDLDVQVRVAPSTVEYGPRATRATYEIGVLVGPDLEPAREHLDDLIAAGTQVSVRDRLLTDDTLGGLVADLRVTACSGYRTFPGPDGNPLLGATWTVTVTTF